MRNVMVENQELAIFDVEDVMRACPVQDIAITLHYGRQRPDYRELFNAFRNGYEPIRSWPVHYPGQLEELMAARSIMLLNRALRTAKNPVAFADRVVTSLDAFLRN